MYYLKFGSIRLGKKTLSEINIVAFSDERSLIQSFAQVMGRNNCYTPKTELQFSADLTAASMISYLRIPYICSDFSFSETILEGKIFFSRSNH